jgi:hypothetical protein
MQSGSPEVQVAATATSTSTGVKTFVIGNVVLSTVLSASLAELFQMIEAQQIALIISCSQIVLPPLPAVFVDQFFQIANFNIFNAGLYFSKVFYMPAVPAFSANFDAVGFNDTYFISNLGSIVLSIVWFIAL